MLDAREFADWLRLLETPGLGRAQARRLLAAFGSPAAVLQAAPSALRALLGPVAGAHLAAALHAGPPGFEARLGAAQAWLAASPRHQALTLDQPAWPALLLQAADAPLLLYVDGDVAALSRPALALVGSRQATAQGRDNARDFAAALVAQGYAVVSGLAQGIDAAAHEGALRAGGCTVAVVGTGLDRCYPTRHAELTARVAAAGAVVSEYAPGTPALPEHFPQRNRIIAALTLGTVVVEAALRSGSLITARLASEAGREVFAVPGSIHAAQSRGCHALIKQGAKLVESAEDILDELIGRARPGAAAPDGGPQPGPAAGAQLPVPADAGDDLLQALGSDPVALDALLARTGCAAADVMARLMALELEGQVARLPGGFYQRRFSA